MPVSLIPAESYVRSTWKNGLGHTDQIAIDPPDASLARGDFRWRLSTASISTASDFSVFANHDRGFVILTGAGIRLTHRDPEADFVDTVELTPLEPYEFPGDLPSRCELLGGPVTDLGVFYPRDTGSAAIEIVGIDDDGAWMWETGEETEFLFATRGGFEVGMSETETLSVRAGDCVRWDRAGLEPGVALPIVPHGPGTALVRVRLSGV